MSHGRHSRIVIPEIRSLGSHAMLNWIWLGILTVAALVAGVTGRLAGLTDGALKGAETSVTVAFGLIGVMTLWLGLMRLAERSGMVQSVASLLRPLLRRLFPEVPESHPAMGSMVLNIAANALGLTNAATPLGLRAMRDLQSLNRHPDTASDAMCTFLAINTGSVQLIPTTAIAILAANGSANPTAIIGTTLLATTCSSATGLAVVRLTRGLRWFRAPDRTVNATPEPDSIEAAPSDTPLLTAANTEPLSVGRRILFGLLVLVFAGFAAQILFNPAAGSPNGAFFVRLIEAVSVVALPFLFVAIPVYGTLKGLRAYEEFVEGAKEGFATATRIIPYLVAMLVAIGALRGAGGIEWITRTLEPLLRGVGYPAELVPMTLLRPLTGSGTLAAFTDLVKSHGADSLLARMGGTLFGSTETTFYVIAVYFGSVGVRRTRNAILAGLSADIAGSIAAVWVCRMMLG
jgi:spore maturation protein SpmA